MTEQTLAASLTESDAQVAIDKAAEAWPRTARSVPFPSLDGNGVLRRRGSY
jgi:hypothetical protein